MYDYEQLITIGDDYIEIRSPEGSSSALGAMKMPIDDFKDMASSFIRDCKTLATKRILSPAFVEAITQKLAALKQE